MSNPDIQEVFQKAYEKNEAQSKDNMRLVNDIKSHINKIPNLTAAEVIEQSGPVLYVTSSEHEYKAVMIACYREESDYDDAEHQWPEYNAWRYSVCVEEQIDYTFSQELLENPKSEKETLSWVLEQTNKAFKD